MLRTVSKIGADAKRGWNTKLRNKTQSGVEAKSFAACQRGKNPASYSSRGNEIKSSRSAGKSQCLLTSAATS
jgi:hypothetical protein